MKTFGLVGLISLSTLTATLANDLLVRPDTTRPKQSYRRPAQAILPGYQLDTAFSGLAAPDPAVYGVVPGWLRAKAAGKPIYVIDGKVATASQLKGLKASAVSSVHVMPGKRATVVYGLAAREGVVAITTKAGLQAVKGPPK